jgi:hypothetical protein
MPGRAHFVESSIDMPDFRVTYRDGRTHVVTADKYGPYGENFVFTLDGEEIAIIARTDVESVVHTNIPEAELPEEPVQAARPFGFG